MQKQLPLLFTKRTLHVVPTFFQAASLAKLRFAGCLTINSRVLRLLVLFFLSTNLFPVKAIEELVKVSNVEFSSNTLSLKHNSLVDIRFKKRIFTNPNRMVFDVFDAQIVGDKKYHFDGLAGEVSSIKVSQFDKTTVRVACEAKNVSLLEKIKIENIGQVLYLKFNTRNTIIQNISFQDGDLRIVSDGPMVPRSILLDNPKRLVLDVIGAELKSKSQEGKIGNGTEEDIKVSQFDDSIVRFVFTGKQTHKRDVRISDNEKQLLVLGKANDSSQSDQQQSSVQKLSVIKIVSTNAKESTYLLSGKAKLNYKFIKMHHPDRLIVDLIDVTLDDSFGADPLPETPQIKDVRFGVTTLGRPVSRIVFDIKGQSITEEFKESEGGKEVYIRFKGREGLSDDSVEPAQKSKGNKVVIDAGHGGYDFGAIYGGYNEKDITMSISRKVYRYLSEAGIDAYLLRDEDRFISLAERVEISNTIGPKVFVSIHANAVVTNPAMQGLQTYYHSPGGYKLATYTHKQMVKDVGMPDRNIRKSNFWVCRYTSAPSILIETGFMTNVDERKKLARESYQEELAKAISRGIINYLEENR